MALQFTQLTGNTKYDISAPNASSNGNAVVRLSSLGYDAGETDEVKLVGSGTTTVTASGDTITISSTGLTSDQSTKLSGIATGAQVNVLESVKINGTALSISSKAVNIPIATTSNFGVVKSSTTGTTTGRDYKVQVNSDGTMKVNVPWTVDSSSAGNRTSGKVVSAAADGQINTEKMAITSSGTVKATIQYDTTYNAIKFVFA